MDLTATGEQDVLALPIRARLFSALTDLRRPATTQELAEAVGRHPNTVRVQLGHLQDAGLIEGRTVHQARGRPRHKWRVRPEARPAGEAPQAYGPLSAWLARAAARAVDLGAVEDVGTEIGRELAPERDGRPLAEAMHDALAALGFAPRADGLRFTLQNCPYREAVSVNQPVVCSLHRGISRGLIEKLDPHATLAAFVAKDPFSAGCLVEVAT